MPWSDQFLTTRGIRSFCRKKILDEIFSPMKVKNQWKILIVDEFGMKILSCCFKTEEVIAFNIALFEVIDKPREPLPYLSAMYLLYPSKQNISFLQADFISSTPKYLNVHLFFLSAVPFELFKEMLKYTSPAQVQTFKEVDFLFLPYESQIFSLHDERFFRIFFDGCSKEMDVNYWAFVAKKLASFCVTLKVLPKIRYRRHFIKNFTFAEAVREELNCHLGSLPSDSSNMFVQPRCELVILDRGFDCVSPVVHEVTLQAMAYDLLDIEDDVYVYCGSQNDPSERIKVPLTEDDLMWCKLRHQHIAKVSKNIDGIFETNAVLRRHQTLPELGEDVRKHLSWKNQPHSIYRRMANECLKLYCEGKNVIAIEEKNLALGLISENSLEDMRTSVLDILGNKTYTMSERLRVLLLYIFYRKGVTQEEFNDIITSSEIPFSEARILTNVLHLDVDIFRPGSCKAVDYITRETDSSTSLFEISNWIPAIKNIILSCVDGSLSHEMYPYLDIKDYEPSSPKKRSGYWCSDKREDHAARLIIFIAGGITYSEMRSVYEVMAKNKGWEIYLGGDSFLTAQKFLDRLKELPFFISKNV